MLLSSFCLGVALQVENEFILQSEKETFIEQMKDIIDKAEDMLSEDTEGERSSDQGTSPQQDTDRLEMNEVRHVKERFPRGFLFLSGHLL